VCDLIKKALFTCNKNVKYMSIIPKKAACESIIVLSNARFNLFHNNQFLLLIKCFVKISCN